MPLVAAGEVLASCGGFITPPESTVKINGFNIALDGSVLDDLLGFPSDIDPVVKATQSTVLVGGIPILAVGDLIPYHEIKESSESPVPHIGAEISQTSVINVNVGL